MPRPVKRSFTIDGHRTSISLESAFWETLKEVAREDGLPVARLVQLIDRDRGNAGLSSSVRVWLLNRFRNLAANRSADGAAEGPGLEPSVSPSHVPLQKRD